ncbi:hypothetical protein RRG08_016322 [Elysia crispata]|uniref:Uncharacterized protein n=1 Tax=Elysia crispata TaxID=231223 RepID=A0AAE1AX83_9GAST|nr:hypothetical protein RRG08_016322 [Elysia crispata]
MSSLNPGDDIFPGNDECLNLIMAEWSTVNKQQKIVVGDELLKSLHNARLMKENFTPFFKRHKWFALPGARIENDRDFRAAARPSVMS